MSNYKNHKKIVLVFFMLLVTTNTINAQDSYDEHMFFDNAKHGSNYHYSYGEYSKPSSLKFIDTKLLTDSITFLSVPNSLKLQWKSGPGGNWNVSINKKRWRGQANYIGDTLSFWCFSKKKISVDKLPDLSLKNRKGGRTPTVAFRDLIDEKVLQEGKWIHIKIPFNRFVYDPEMAQPTYDFDFDHSLMNTITFSQGIDDNEDHIIYIDDIVVINGNSSKQLEAPSNLKARSYDRHIDITWESVDGLVKYYKIYRSKDGKKFKDIGIQRPEFNRYSDYVGLDRAPFYYRITAVDYNQKESEISNSVTASTRELSEEELLTMVQEAGFLYYWESANSNSGLARENIPGRNNLIASGASGFGIMALLVGIERNFISREEGRERIIQILNFLEKSDRFHGVWPHFLDDATGKTIALFGPKENGGDLVETSFLMQGLLTVRQYFDRNNKKEKSIRSQITKLWESIEWDWYRKEPTSDFLYWHWSPDYEWAINHPLVGWNETMITYLLAIASPTHSVPESMYHTGWAGQSDVAIKYRQDWGKTSHGDHYENGNTYYDIRLDVGVGSGGPLFFTHYSFMGFDPRDKTDKYTNYFENNRKLALINRAYCVDNPKGYKGYGEDAWGLTASDNYKGYLAHDPSQKNDNGTITPTAALGAMPYTPKESMKALKHFYYNKGKNLWGIYGFKDAYNEMENWVSEIYMGLNQAPIVVMIENHRTGLLWNLFMSHPDIKKMSNSLFKNE